MLGRQFVRRISTQQDLLAAAQKVSAVPTPPINPITFHPTPIPVDAHPPRPGPAAYPSPRQNPMSREHISLAQNLTAVQYQRANYRFDCHSTRNNTITTLSTLTYKDQRPDQPPHAQVVAWFSGGSVGFKKAQRGQYEAGYQCAVRLFKLLETLSEQRQSTDLPKIDLYFKGFGQGRDALKTAIMSSEGDRIRDFIIRVIDRTGLKIGGTKPKKTRRL